MIFPPHTSILPQTLHGTAIGLPIRPGVLPEASFWGGSPDWQSQTGPCTFGSAVRSAYVRFDPFGSIQAS